MIGDTNPGKKWTRDYKELMIDGAHYFASRDEYMATFGEEAPPDDSTKRVKRWVCRPTAGAIPGTRFAAMVLARDPETGEVLADPSGSPFLMSYSFSYEAAAAPNLPYNITNEKLILPETWVPLRPLESYEKLAFRSQLPPEAGLLVVFSSNNAFLLNARYQPQPATHPEDLIAVLLRVEKKVDQILDLIQLFVPPQSHIA